MSHDSRIDAYIERQADFARPILERLRAIIHRACPEAEETIKWGAPAFLYKGEILAIMAGFKAHAALNLWRGRQVTGDQGGEDGMGQFGRITSLEDLPGEEAIAAPIRKSMELTDQGVKPLRAPKSAPRPPAEAPDDLKAALAVAPAARATFDGFGPGARREYVDWIVEAKQAATRAKRIAQAVEWLSEGKKRNWKYEKC